MMMKKLISLLVLIIVAFPTVARIPKGDYIMIDKKKGGFVGSFVKVNQLKNLRT